ncbi:MAG TPA: hypothetical protein EYO98_03390, partial [Candidatus Poseidoniales archaeon]|nr:hypothetical protein [Candidatus Poseidoniales archaeon]
MRKVLMLLCAACLLTAGCLDSLPIIGEDDDVVVTVSAMSSDEVETLLNDIATMDIAALAEAEERFRAEIYSKGIEDGEVMEMTIVLAKDEVSQLSEVGIEFQSGMIGVDYSIVQGASTDVNIKVGSQWFLARDAAPEYVDPFTDTGEEEEDEGDDSSGDDFTEEFEELLPDFDDISFDTEGIEWVVTIDQMSLQQVATGSNDTHEIMVEFLEMPPRLHSLEVLSANGSEAMSVTLDWGGEVALELRTDVPRTSVMLEIEESVDSEEFEDDSFVWICGDGIELSPELVLDGTVDCADSSDEEAMYQCVNGDYILFSWLNDDEIDCSDSSDEDDGSD